MLKLWLTERFYEKKKIRRNQQQFKTHANKTNRKNSECIYTFGRIWKYKIFWNLLLRENSLFRSARLKMKMKTKSNSKFVLIFYKERLQSALNADALFYFRFFFHGIPLRIFILIFAPINNCYLLKCIYFRKMFAKNTVNDTNGKMKKK